MFILQKFNSESFLEFAAALERSLARSSAPFVILVDSYGGDAYNSIGMYDLLMSAKRRGKTIVTCCASKAMSAGLLIFSAGDYRFMTKHATLMLHKASGGTRGHVEDIEVDTTELKRISDIYLNLIGNAFKGGVVKMQKYITKNARDMYINQAEALRLGVANRKGMPAFGAETIMQCESDATLLEKE